MKYVPFALRLVISLAIVGGAVAGFFWLGESEVYTRPPARESVPQVKTIVADNHLDGLQIEVDGVVVPYRQINIAAEVGGKVIYKSDRCRTGRTVKAGEVLIRIDPQDYELEVRRLMEELNQADATIGELKAELQTTENQITAAEEQLDIEQRQLRRNLDLLKRLAASDSEVDTVRKSELATRNSLQMLVDQKQLIKRRKVRLESAKMLGQANLERASLALDRTEIRSPIDAIVVSDLVEQDGYVQAGVSMLALQDSSSLDVTCMLHDHEMNWLWQSEPTTSETSMSVALGDVEKDKSQDPAKLVSTEVKNPATDEADVHDFPRHTSDRGL